ncbi:hypothetical protein Ddye_017394 [Dipteronia dyeriana]|uniref:Uncharacterized protein n=1 Tax=Dipteronia dyeriana TaxID=168575 RepID=A0AAD9X1E3_9ROSI|nr:hypothetical protein Ddye_017394 [Dipteronia dyeriana]
MQYVISRYAVCFRSPVSSKSIPDMERMIKVTDGVLLVLFLKMLEPYSRRLGFLNAKLFPAMEMGWPITLPPWHCPLEGFRCGKMTFPACFEGNPFKTVPGPFKLFWRCMRSNPGEEPTEPYTYLQFDPPTREVKLE